VHDGARALGFHRLAGRARDAVHAGGVEVTLIPHRGPPPAPIVSSDKVDDA
jgi:hypothetical protein